MCEEYYMKRIFSFTEGMVLDSYSFLEVGEEQPPLVFFFKKTESNDPFWNHFQPIACFLVCVCFYAPGLKGPPGASSVRIVCPSVRLSVCPSVCLSVRNSVPLTNKVQYLKFGWSYSNQTWTVSSSKSCSHSSDNSSPLGWGGVKILDLQFLPDFNFVAAGGIRVSQTHV